MSTVYNPVAANSTESITVPDDGDNANVASIAALLRLADRLKRIADSTTSTTVSTIRDWTFTASAAGTTAVTASGGYVGFKGTGSSVGVWGLATASSNGYGGTFQGDGTGYGMEAYPGSGTSDAAMAYGRLIMSGVSADKNPTATTAISDRLCAKNLVKAWGLVVDGSLVDGFNIASVAIDGTDNYVLNVTMASAMASANYAIICTGSSGFGSNTFRSVAPRHHGHADAPTTTTFSLEHRSLADAGTVAISDSEFTFMVLGVQ
ncbi:MAG: hypothetical protein ACWGPR_08495 [Candidatus Deferrimicrobiaceae bacterium]